MCVGKMLQSALRASATKGAGSSKKMEYHRFYSSSSLDSIQSNEEPNLCYACTGEGPPGFHSAVCDKHPGASSFDGDSGAASPESHRVNEFFVAIQDEESQVEVDFWQGVRPTKGHH